jgi:hypothetical protein
MSGLETNDYWAYIWASYAIAVGSLGLLAGFAYLRLKRWAAKAGAATAEADAPTGEGR